MKKTLKFSTRLKMNKNLASKSCRERLKVMIIKIFHIYILVSGLALLMIACNTSEKKHDNIKPNILFLVSEDHNEQLGCYGDTVIQTPVLDSLAAKGVRFTNAYVTQAGCSPSRSSILTGLYPHQNGQIGLATHKYRMYDPHTPNMPAMMKKNGYHTVCIGKIHVNPESDFAYDEHIHGKFTTHGKIRDVKKVAAVADTIMRGSKKPFFLWISFADAHYPFIRQFDSLPLYPLGPKDVKVPTWIGLNTITALTTTANYYNCIERLDTGIGMVLDALKKSGKADNTLIIFLSDHGMQSPRGKRTSYEGGVKIPMIMYWPGKIPQGMIINKLVSTIDLMPTVLEVAGIKEKPDIPGKSLLPLLKGLNVKWRKYLFTEYNVHWPENLYPQRTVRDKQFKLIHNLMYERPNPNYEQYLVTGTPKTISPKDLFTAPDSVKQAYKIFHHPPEYELYNLLSDPWEYHNLSDNPEFAEVLDSLKTILADWQVRTNDPLRHKDILRKLDEENKSTFIHGKYENVRKRKDFEWKYPEYFFPKK